MDQKTTVSFKKGKIPRNELELPTLHFVVMDQWLDVIGEKALFSWLKMYTWCKRDVEDSEINLWEQAKIPTSYNKVIKKLGVGKDTFYNRILKPLWNVGMIDIEEYEESDSKGNKPMNIIVYKYPQNDKSLAFKPLEIIRNYDSEYSSTAKSFASKGGRRPKRNEEVNGDGSETEPPIKDGSEIEPGVVLNENQGGFLNRTRDGSEIGHNNTLNSFNNSFNTLNNLLNTINNSLNSSSSINLENENTRFQIKEEEENNNEISVSPIALNVLKEVLTENDLYDDRMIENIVLEMTNVKVSYFTKKEILNQHRFMIQKIDQGEKIYDWAKYFVGGILKTRLSETSANRQQRLDETKRVLSENKKRNEEPRIKRPLYNWLES